MSEWDTFTTSMKIQKVTKMKHASSPHRLVAGFIDLLSILLVSCLLLLPAIFVAIDSSNNPSPERSWALLLIGILSGGLISLWEVAYRVLIPYFQHGQTFGMRLLKMKMLSENGDEPSLKQLLARGLSQIFLVIFSLGIYYLAELFALLISTSTSDYADVISETIVVETDYEE
jgi:uncharacterized RDD family membrane protein YckC